MGLRLKKRDAYENLTDSTTNLSASIEIQLRKKEELDSLIEAIKNTTKNLIQKGYLEINLLDAKKLIQRYGGLKLTIEQLDSGLHDLKSLKKSLANETDSFVNSLSLLNKTNQLLQDCISADISVTDVTNECNVAKEYAYNCRYSECDKILKKAISNIEVFLRGKGESNSLYRKVNTLFKKSDSKSINTDYIKETFTPINDLIKNRNYKNANSRMKVIITEIEEIITTHHDGNKEISSINDKITRLGKLETTFPTVYCNKLHKELEAIITLLSHNKFKEFNKRCAKLNSEIDELNASTTSYTGLLNRVGEINRCGVWTDAETDSLSEFQELLDNRNFKKIKSIFSDVSTRVENKYQSYKQSLDTINNMENLIEESKSKMTLPELGDWKQSALKQIEKQDFTGAKDSTEEIINKLTALLNMTDPKLNITNITERVCKDGEWNTITIGLHNQSCIHITSLKLAISGEIKVKQGGNIKEVPSLLGLSTTTINFSVLFRGGGENILDIEANFKDFQKSHYKINTELPFQVLSEKAIYGVGGTTIYQGDQNIGQIQVKKRVTEIRDSVVTGSSIGGSQSSQSNSNNHGENSIYVSDSVIQKSSIEGDRKQNDSMNNGSGIDPFELYETAIRHTFTDGTITAAEEKYLEKLRNKYNITLKQHNLAVAIVKLEKGIK